MKSLNQALFETAYQWFVDNNCVPYIHCYHCDFIKAPGLRNYIKTVEGLPALSTITLNIAPKACELEYHPDYLIFRCRVNGVKCEEFIPWQYIWVMQDVTDKYTVFTLPQMLIKDNAQHSQQPETQPTQPKAGVIPKFGLIVGGKE